MEHGSPRHLRKKFLSRGCWHADTNAVADPGAVKRGGGGAGNPNSLIPRPKIGQNRPKKTKIGRKKGGAAADSAPPGSATEMDN